MIGIIKLSHNSRIPMPWRFIYKEFFDILSILNFCLWFLKQLSLFTGPLITQWVINCLNVWSSSWLTVCFCDDLFCGEDMKCVQTQTGGVIIVACGVWHRCDNCCCCGHGFFASYWHVVLSCVHVCVHYFVTSCCWQLCVVFSCEHTWSTWILFKTSQASVEMAFASIGGGQEA